MPQRKGLAVQIPECPQGRLLVEQVDDVEVYLERFGFIRERVETLHKGKVRLSPGRISPVTAAVVDYNVHMFQVDRPANRRSAHNAEEATDFQIPWRDVGPIHLELVRPVGAQRSIDQLALRVVVEEPEIKIAINVRAEAAVLVRASQTGI